MNAAWFVSANNKMFGPYSQEQMKEFALQKRVGPTSMVRLGSDGDFMVAEQHAALARLFEEENISSSATKGAGGIHSKPMAGMPDGEMSNFVVIVDFKSGLARQFDSELKSMGRMFRLNSSTWLLQSERPSAAIKTALAPFVGGEDPILIIDCGRNRMAWHNMGVFEASTIRDLWKLPHERSQN